MSSFDDIPEDSRESHPCPDCASGNVVFNPETNKWECDYCDFSQNGRE